MSQAGANGSSGGGGGSGAIDTITGNTGGAESPSSNNFNFLTANSTVKFAGTAATETLDFGIRNLILGAAPASINTSATDNVGLGRGVFTNLTTGLQNIGIGGAVLEALSTGSDNVVVGYDSATSNNGSGNVIIGPGAFQTNATGSNSIVIGISAGALSATSDSNNIYLGHAGVGGESNTMRLGTSGTAAKEVSKAFVAGVTGVTAVGSPVAVNSSGQLSDLGFGTAGQILTSAGASASATWQAPGSTLIATVTASNQAAVQFTTGLSSSYKMLRLIANNVQVSITAGNLEMQCSTNGGSSYDSGINYEYSITFNRSDSASDWNRSNPTMGVTGIQVMNPVPSSAISTNSGSMDLEIFGVGQATTYLTLQTRNVVQDVSGISTQTGAGAYATAASVNAIQFVCNDGSNIVSGNFYLYGVN